jgi:hypothetical protein
MDNRVRLLLSIALAAALSATTAYAWGPDGHRMIGELAMKSLPAELPAFLHTTEAAQEVGYLAPEPDRERSAGKAQDAEHDPGHFVDVLDDLTVQGGPALKALPLTREQYDTELRIVGSDQYKAGYLPYSIIAGYQLLTKDFVYWRADVAGGKFAKTDAERTWFAHDRAEREKIALHDLGVWSHFVGDGSMPLHISVHYDGWGDYPDPKGYTKDPIHVPWENQYVHDNIAQTEVAAAMPAAHDCVCGIEACTASYLSATQAQVIPFYDLVKARDIRLTKRRDVLVVRATDKGNAFTVTQIALGAAELRDLVTAAWKESANGTVGYPAIKVTDVETGKTDPYAELSY